MGLKWGMLKIIKWTDEALTRIPAVRFFATHSRTMELPFTNNPMEMTLTSGMVLIAAFLGNHTAGPPLIQHQTNLPRNYTTSYVIPASTFMHNGTDSSLDKGEWTPKLEDKTVKKRASAKLALEGKTLRLVTLKDWPLSDIKINKTSNQTYGIGVAFRFVELLRKKFGFNYTIVPTSENTAKSVVNMITGGKADMAAAFLPMLYTRKVSYSKALAKEEWVVLLRRPQESASGSSLLAPFDTTVWILILLSVFIVGPVMYAIMVVRVRLCRGSSRLSKVFSLTSCVWFVYGALMKQGSTLNPISDSSRLLFATWWIFITVVTAFYTANLTAFLTLSRFTLPINGPLDIASKSFRWIGQSGSPLESIIYVNLTTLNWLLGQMLSHLLLSQNVMLRSPLYKDGLMFIREKRVVDRLLFRDYLRKIEDGIEESQRCTFAITPESFNHLPMAFFYPLNSTLPKLFNPLLTSLVEAGIVNHLMNSDLPHSEICPLNLGNKDRQLRNADLLTTYKAVAIGLSVAAIAFAGEQALRLCLKWKRIKSKRLFMDKMKKRAHFESISFNSWFIRKWMRGAKDKKQLKSNKVGRNELGGTVSKRRGALQDHENSIGTMTVHNGREYLRVHEDTLGGVGITKLIPVRAPSAVLFERSHRGREGQIHSRKNIWKGSVNVI
ncbi:glutamate receptor ionotropic, kainate 2 [Hetaerina americana]|uniref:glutamate receptor ionotropic, kainate 2 n=1 Tax=Hetaerina americana TaxID=62018 RepID=UPI003A7F1457